MNCLVIWQSQMDQLVSHGKTMKIRALGGVKAEYVSIRGGSRLQDACDSQQGMDQFTKELIAMISSNIFRDIMVLCRVNTRMSNLFAEQYHHSISFALNED